VLVKNNTKEVQKICRKIKEKKGKEKTKLKTIHCNLFTHVPFIFQKRIKN